MSESNESFSCVNCVWDLPFESLGTSLVPSVGAVSPLCFFVWDTFRRSPKSVNQRITLRDPSNLVESGKFSVRDLSSKSLRVRVFTGFMRKFRWDPCDYTFFPTLGKESWVLDDQTSETHFILKTLVCTICHCCRLFPLFH